MTQYQSYFGTKALGGATGLVFSLYYAGAMVSALFGPFLSDTYGRKMPIIVGSVIALIGAIIQASSFSIEQFRAARFIVGLGSSLCFGFGPLLTVEMAHPFWRGRLGGLLMLGVLGGNTFSNWMDFAGSWAKSDFAWRFPVCPPIFQSHYVVGFANHSPNFVFDLLLLVP
jgi:MFS family permease